jgi:competence protein ComEA
MKKLMLVLLFLFAGNVFAVVDINTAKKEELEAVKGIGPKKAEAIVANRPYKSLDDLKKVKGFGGKSFAKLSKDLAVGGATTTTTTTTTTPATPATPATPGSKK